MNLETLLAHYPAISGTRLNLVVSSKLKFTGDSATSSELSNPDDRTLLVHLRKLAGLIITDAATAAAEGYKPSKLAPIDVWSRSGNFRGLEASQAVGDRHALTLSAIDDLEDAVAVRLAKYGSILFETGPTLSAELGAQGLIDEFCLTISACGNEEMAIDVAHRTCEQLGLTYLETNQPLLLNNCAYLRLTG